LGALLSRQQQAERVVQIRLIRRMSQRPTENALTLIVTTLLALDIREIHARRRE
jgi:hypothetical protein